MATPYFSIIIPCYNQGNFLKECLDSLFRQSFKDWEAIIINDGSTDNTATIAEAYAAIDTRIILVHQSNGGLSSARNSGIKVSSGERFIFLDADDYIYDDCLQVLADQSKGLSSEYLMMYGYTYISEDNCIQLHSHLPGNEYELIPFVFSKVLGPCHSICISKELLKHCGFFDESLRSLEDWDMWIRAAKAGGKLRCIQQCLVYYRYVNNSMSRNAPVMYQAFKEVARRAPLKDNRLSNLMPGNHDYSFDVQPVLLDCLLKTLGVHLMQGHVEESIGLFKKESSVNINIIPQNSFESMCSSLSFRYWNSQEQVRKVTGEIMPYFSEFFHKSGMYPDRVKKIMFVVFKRQLYYKNIFEWGPWIGRLKNYFLRRRYQMHANA